MVHKQPSASMASSWSSSYTVRDDGPSIWQYRVCHSVGEIKIDEKTGENNTAKMKDGEGTKEEITMKKETIDEILGDNNDAEMKNGEGTKEQTTIKKEVEGTDDMYYLRWNPMGDYDSDDDWWNEVVALGRKSCRKNRKREKRVKTAAARVLEEALYQRYKYHTGKVMKWGNTLWADHHSGQRSDSDEQHLSLRTMIGRLNSLALDNIAMPPVIYRHLKHAVELREEFSTRYVLERKSQEGNNCVLKTRRRKNVGKSPMHMSLSRENSHGESNDAININIEKNNRDIPKKATIDIPTGNTTPNKTAQEKHQWILKQLEALLDKFKDTTRDHRIGKRRGRRRRKKNIAKNNRNIPVKTSTIHKNPLDGKRDRNNSDKNCGKESCKILMKPRTTDKNHFENKSDTNNRDKNCDKNGFKNLGDSRTTDEYPFNEKPKISSKDGNCDENNFKNLTESCTIDNYLFDEESQKSSGDEKVGHDNIAAIMVSSCDSSTSISASSTVGDDTKCIGQYLTSESTLDDWDEIFGDDGSLIGDNDNQNSDQDSDSENLEIVVSIITQSLEGESQNFLNLETMRFNDDLENDQTNRSPKIDMRKKYILLNSVIPKYDILKIANPANNSVFTDISSQSNNENVVDENKRKLREDVTNTSDDLKHEQTSPQMIINQSNDSEILETSSKSDNVTLTTSVEPSPQQVLQSRKFDSVWDMSLLEEEEANMLFNSRRIQVAIDTISLQNSNPPEDWEMLFEEEKEDDTSVEEAQKEVTENIVTTTTQDFEINTDAVQLTKSLGVRKMDLLSQENNTENKPPSTSISQHGLGQVAVKLTKPAYNVTENLRYDSVWDIFTKEKTSGCVQVIDIDPIIVSSIKTDDTAQPEEDWEALYS